MTEEEWSERFSKITAEHKEERAHEQLAAGWKQLVAARDPTASGAGSVLTR